MTFFDIRRRMLEGAFGVRLSYTGTYDLFGNSSQGFAVLKTSGTLSISGKVDLCLVGGGGKGATGSAYGWTGGGAGGAGGYVSNYIAQELDGNFTVTIGAGASAMIKPGGQTSVGASMTANGGTSATDGVRVTGRGTSGDGGDFGGLSGGKGEDGVFPFDDSVNFASYQVSGCGGGGRYKSGTSGIGGAGGGGNGGGNAGTANTGGGGGGGNCSGSGSSGTVGKGGDGGSGVVFICWGYH